MTNTFCDIVMRRFVSAKILAKAPFSNPLQSNKTFVKFVASMWQLVIHVSMTLIELYILHDESWLEKPWTTYSQPWSNEYIPKTMLRYFFLLQMAIWACTCFSHRFNADAHMHKDYFPMYVHHLVTIMLVTIAYVTNHTRIGFIILFVHDASDIGIDALKICNYLRLEGKQGFFLVETAYASAVGAWIYYRLYMFPIIIYQAAVRISSSSSTWLTVDGISTYGHHLLHTVGIEPAQFQLLQTSYWTGVCLLVILFSLHIWWFALLLRILVRMFKTSAHDAGAAEYEGSDTDDDKLKRK